MALKSTIYKFDVSITDLDRHYYQDHQLTVAKHPSETEARMMLRLLAFIHNASESLEFTKGLSDTEEPDLWQRSLVDEIELWIELGQPSEQRIKKGTNQSQAMKIYSYDDNGFTEFWSKQKNKLSTRNNLNVVTVPESTGAFLVEQLSRTMNLQVTIQDALVYITIGESSTEFGVTVHK